MTTSGLRILLEHLECLQVEMYKSQNDNYKRYQEFHKGYMMVKAIIENKIEDNKAGTEANNKNKETLDNFFGFK